MDGMQPFFESISPSGAVGGGSDARIIDIEPHEQHTRESEVPASVEQEVSPCR